ncbi:hypothetical protein KIL84_017597 [Mauremys mutica]|uniref:Uncharacterized protein n=1 Tax=Mauremys mutica TaxID=74926 RepID=A0A9D4AX11_9SAUR|nr:hypothetical protein KIL84_017597 [Mauremys mutica]
MKGPVFFPGGGATCFHWSSEELCPGPCLIPMCVGGGKRGLHVPPIKVTPSLCGGGMPVHFPWCSHPLRLRNRNPQLDSACGAWSLQVQPLAQRTGSLWISPERLFLQV